jgi:hypothetical protein
MGAAAAVPGKYSAVFVVPEYWDWCWRPNPCPDSWATPSATYFAYPVDRFFGKTQTVFGAELLNAST